MEIFPSHSTVSTRAWNHFHPRTTKRSSPRPTMASCGTPPSPSCPTRDTMTAYIEAALHCSGARKRVAIRHHREELSIKSSAPLASMKLNRNDWRLAIGYTWLSVSAQRTAVNTEAKLLLLTHAFESWSFNRVEFITDVFNQQSRGRFFAWARRRKASCAVTWLCLMDAFAIPSASASLLTSGRR